MKTLVTIFIELFTAAVLTTLTFGAQNVVYANNQVKIGNIRLQGDHNNNKMKRMNGEVHDREKTMRGLKIQNTSVLPGYRNYHNYFRPHEALSGKTPAEACGIAIQGNNKWKTVIENAAKKC